MMYNKNNLTNIYKYDPKLIDKINQNLELYKNNGNESSYMVVIQDVNKNFEYFKKDPRFINYLTDKVYDSFPLIQIQNYIYALKQIYKKNNYNALLLNIKNNEFNKHLDKLFNNLKYFYSIDKREVLEDIYIKKVKKFPNDAEYKEILHLIQNAKSEFIAMQMEREKGIKKFKAINIRSEEEILKNLYKWEYNKFNEKFFENLELLKIEKEKTTNKEMQIEQEMEMW